MSLEYIREYYKVPAVIGRRIRFEETKEGVIVGSRNAYIKVVFDGDIANQTKNLHPTSEVEYLDMGDVPKMTRSQKRYAEYRSCDTDMSFMDWIYYCQENNIKT